MRIPYLLSNGYQHEEGSTVYNIDIDKQFEYVLYQYIFLNTDIMHDINKLTLELPQEKNVKIKKLKKFIRTHRMLLFFIYLLVLLTIS